MGCAVLLIDPRFPHNVGSALRACAVPDPKQWPEGARLPRAERMKCYRNRNTNLHHHGESDELRIASLESGYVSVCVEITGGLYVFGPEEGDVPKGVRHVCHR